MCLAQKLKVRQNAKFRKIAKLRCREICEPQNREISCNKVLVSPVFVDCEHIERESSRYGLLTSNV